MIIPSNLIQTNYTSGNEFVEKNTNVNYIGYYYSLNNSFFVGKTFDPNAVELIKNTDINQLYNSPQTALFSFASGITSQQLQPSTFTSIPKSELDTDQDSNITYYARKTNIIPITIKQISKDDYNKLSTDPFYQTAYVNPNYSNLDQADKQLPGLKTWLLG